MDSPADPSARMSWRLRSWIFSWQSRTRCDVDDLFLVLVTFNIEGVFWQIISFHNLADIDSKIRETREASRFLIELSHCELPAGLLTAGMLSSDTIEPTLETTGEQEIVFVNGENAALLHDAMIQPLRQGDSHPAALLRRFVYNFAPTLKPVKNGRLALAS